MDSVFRIVKYLKEINIVTKNKINKNVLELELTGSQMEVLIYLLKNQEKEINQRDLEKTFNLSNPTVTGILNRLENKEFIVRTISSSDARYKYVSLTEKAVEMDKKMMKHMETMTKEFMKDMSPEEIVTLEKLLEKILKNFSNEEEEDKC